MKRNRFQLLAFWLLACSPLAALDCGRAQAAEALTMRAELVWGTNDKESKYPPVTPHLATKLRASPYRWTNYFEVTNHMVTIPVGQTKAVPMSEKCQLETKNLGGDRVEIKLVGQGKPVSTHKEKLAADWPVIFSGNAKDNTAWLVVITKVDPKAASVKGANK